MRPDLDHHDSTSCRIPTRSRQGAGDSQKMLLWQQIVADVLIYPPCALPSWLGFIVHSEGKTCSPLPTYPAFGSCLRCGLLLAMKQERRRRDMKPLFMEISGLIHHPANSEGYQML